MLGEVLIKTFKTWYKGSIFTLAKNIKKANKEFQIFKKTFDQFKIYDVEIPKDLLSNKSLFLEKILKIEKLLKTHKDYKPIIENIFHNFDYVIKNFNLIEEWLLSNDFNEKYKKENHPYPSLLDPKKLNDENEEINYKTIPAQLVWEMNLSLPDNYEFTWFFRSCSGSMAMYAFFSFCSLSCQSYAWEPGYIMYQSMYDYMKKTSHSIAVVPSITKNLYFMNEIMMKKLLFLYPKCKNVIFIVRDPISIIKHALNHIDGLVFNNINEQMKKYIYPIRFFFFLKCIITIQKIFIFPVLTRNHF
ncbi:hypothetical protein H2278_01845 [Campylobacter sp. W0018]|nr:hypothetical protein [Campylobacter sp. W0018]